jgi:hypothetical protein
MTQPPLDEHAVRQRWRNAFVVWCTTFGVLAAILTVALTLLVLVWVVLVVLSVLFPVVPWN